MPTIGTAGHVDHGKSALVRALTGIDPDRLEEEKVRGMTIDLGFAWLTLPDGQQVSIVDVPGHEDFIKNMLAGVGGIDLALLVVAADEGIMPQTVEHLAILDLLRVPQGVVALTKCDLVDAEWLELVRSEIVTALEPTCLAAAPIIPVSATTGFGLDALKQALAERIRPHPPAPSPSFACATDGEGELADRVIMPDPKGVQHARKSSEGVQYARKSSVGVQHAEPVDERSNVQSRHVPLSMRQHGEGSGVGPPRLPIDRVFTISGFGTVVTGTLLDGALRVGDEVEIAPGTVRARVRGIQQHKAAAHEAQPGTRAALNLAGVDRALLARGMVVTLPGALIPTTRLDVWLECWHKAPRGIQHNMRLDLFVGAAVVPAQVKLLDGDEIRPGAAGWAQLVLTHPIAALKGDRFIVRNPSPSETLGGGAIVDPLARQHRRRQPDVLARLAALGSADPVAVVGAVLRGDRGNIQTLTVAEIARIARLPAAQTQAALAALQQRGDALALGEWYIARAHWDALCQRSRAALMAYHQQYPLRLGMPREAWRALINLPRQIDAVTEQMVELGHISVATSRNLARPVVCVALPEHAPRLSATQQQQRDMLRAMLGYDLLNPPAVAEIERVAPHDVLEWALEQGVVVRLNAEVILHAVAFHAAQTTLVAYLRDHERITVAEARDLLGGTRRVIVPLLELCDALQITRRIGDARVLGLRA